MCTVTWLYNNDGYQVFCNRDEKRSRKLATDPRIAETDGVHYVAPVDGDHGGTWIGVNEYGVTASLLNGSPVHSRGRVSRGLLVPHALAGTSAAGARARVRRMSLEHFAPFVLVTFDLTTKARLLEWTGAQLIEGDADSRLPLASSSSDPEGVRETRHLQFAKLRDRGASAPTLAAFHASHESGPSAYSPCMHRTDAATVSFSHVDVSRTGAAFHYSPAAPCAQVPAITITIPLLPPLRRAA